MRSKYTEGETEWERESAKDKDSGGETERESFGYTHTRTHKHQHTCAHACDRAKTLKTQLSTDDAQTEKSKIQRERKRVSDKPNRSTDQTNEPNSTPANWRLNRKPEETRNQANFIELFAPKPLTEGKQKQRSKLSSKKTWQVQAQLKRAKWVWIREWEWERESASNLLESIETLSCVTIYIRLVTNCGWEISRSAFSLTVWVMATRAAQKSFFRFYEWKVLPVSTRFLSLSFCRSRLFSVVALPWGLHVGGRWARWR